MKFKKNKFVIFYIFNIILLIFLLTLAIPVSKFLSQINFENSEVVINQSVIQPNAKSQKVIDRTIDIRFIAKVHHSLEWEFKSLQDSIQIKI